MSDKVSWLLLQYDKTHEKSGLIVSGAFSAEFIEWIIKGQPDCSNCSYRIEALKELHKDESDWQGRL